MRTILVTGGAGYIGSHACVTLLDAGHEVVVIDNLANSSAKSLDAIAAITGRRVDFYERDLTDDGALDELFENHPIDSVMHFAGLKAVGESVDEPARYWRTNVLSSLNLVEAMARHDVWTLVFSSSATVYGAAETMPLVESAPLGATNPYGNTKLVIEQLLGDVAASDARWRIALLRYFNPVGAHDSGLIGEDPQGIPNNLMPYVMQVAVGKRDVLPVFGNDYPTPDGTCIRDYIHVMDLVGGHLAALDYLDHTTGCEPFNLGTGTGTSVLEVIAAATEAVGHEIPYEVTDRRAGDSPVSFADPSKANQALGWRADRAITTMVRDHWNWQRQHPDGYRT